MKYVIFVFVELPDIPWRTFFMGFLYHRNHTYLFFHLHSLVYRHINDNMPGV